MLTKKQKSFILWKLYIENIDTNEESRYGLWDKLEEMEEFYLDSKIQEDAEHLVELFPDLEEQILDV